MKHVAVALLLGFIISISLSDAVTRDKRTAKAICPDAAAIAPCECSVDTSDQLNMVCSSITSDAQLFDVFRNDFPEPNFHEFRLYLNPNFTQLGTNIFGNVTFQKIDIFDTNINLVSEYALLSSANSLYYIRIDYGHLTENTFPFSSVKDYPNLESLIVANQRDLTVIPPITSNSLTRLNLGVDSISSILPGKQKPIIQYHT